MLESMREIDGRENAKGRESAKGRENAKDAKGRERRENLLDAVTLEHTLYAVLAIAALFIRVFLVGNAPLASDEARQALASFNFLHGNPDPFVGSPLLFTGNWLLFTLLGDNDATARLLPALFGGALVLAPILFRRELGRAGALIASALLVFSPTLVFFSRTADAAIPAITCALFALGFAWRGLSSPPESGQETQLQPRALNIAAIFAALALLAGREVWVVVFAAAFFAVYARRANQSAVETASTTAQSRPSSADLEPAKAGFVPLLPRWFDFAHHKFQSPVLLFAITFIAVGTTFFLRRDGFGAAIDALGGWLTFRAGESQNIAGMLLLYEPLIVVFGVAGILQSLQRFKDNAREELPFVSLAFATAFCFLLFAFGLSADSSRLVNLVVPLAIFAARWLGEWVTQVWEAFTQWEEERATLTQQASLFALASVLIVFIYLVIVEFIQRGNVLAFDALLRGGEGNATGLFIVILTLGAFGALALMTVASVGWWRAQNIGVALLVLWLGGWGLRQSTMLNFLPPNTSEPLVARAASPNIRDLVRDLEDISRWRANDSHTLAIRADESLGPIVAWYLRAFPRAQFAARPVIAPEVQALILASNAPPPASDWISQRYQLEIARAAPPPNFLRWLIFREGSTATASYAVLWAQKP